MKSIRAAIHSTTSSIDLNKVNNTPYVAHSQQSEHRSQQVCRRIRDKSIQKDSMRFRRNLERIGEVMAYEISKTFEYAVKVVETPLGEASVAMISDQVVIATILRAGLPFHQGFLNYFDDAQNAFVSAYRKSTKDGKFTVKVEYTRVVSWRARLCCWSIPCWLPVLPSCWPTMRCANGAGSPRIPMSRRYRQRTGGRICGEEYAQSARPRSGVLRWTRN